MLPNPRLQRTRAALRLQSLSGQQGQSGGARRAPLSRKPLGDSPSMESGVELELSRTPRQSVSGEARRIGAPTPVPSRLVESQQSPNPRLQRTRAALWRQSLVGEHSSFGGDRRAPLSRQPLGG